MAQHLEVINDAERDPLSGPPCSLRVGSWNVRSLAPKLRLVVGYMQDQDLDALILQETKEGPDDALHEVEARHGLKVYTMPAEGRSGGLATLVRPHADWSIVPSRPNGLAEHRDVQWLAAKHLPSDRTLHIINVYAGFGAKQKIATTIQYREALRDNLSGGINTITSSGPKGLLCSAEPGVELLAGDLNTHFAQLEVDDPSRYPEQEGWWEAVSYTHLTLPTN